MLYHRFQPRHRQRPTDPRTTDGLAPEGISIGNDVWIAAQCTVLKGARINDHAVIGAQSLVNSEIPEDAICFGTPAMVKKYRG